MSYLARINHSQTSCRYRFFRRAIVSPSGSCVPYLPTHVVFSSEYQRIASYAIPKIVEFLNTLPSAPKVVYEAYNNKAARLEVSQLTTANLLSKLLKESEAFKEQGNRALKERNRDLAIEFYTKAVNHFSYLLPLTVAFKTEHKKLGEEASKLAAICYGNRAAAWMFENYSQEDALKALKDSQQAQKHDPGYSKA